MAGFLRKKSKQDPRAKSAQVSPPVVTSAPASVPPLYARFTSSNNSTQESQRIISSPMVLSSARRDVAPAPHHRAGRTGAGNSVNVVRRDTREIETRGQRNQNNIAEKIPETLHDQGTHRHSQYPQLRQPEPGPVSGNGVNVVRQNTQDAEARRQWNQPSSVATVHDAQNDGGSRSPFSHRQQLLPAQIGTHARARPMSRIPLTDKPLPPSIPHPFSSNSPTTPTQASVNWGNDPLSTATTVENNSLPRPPVLTPGNLAPLPRRPADHTTDPKTSKHHRAFSLTSSPDLSTLTVQPQLNPSSALLVQGSNNLTISPLLNNQTSFQSSSSSDPDHDLRPQTLTPRPSNRSLSRQDLQGDKNGSRSDSGASTSQASLVPDNAHAAQHQRLLQALEFTDDLNETEHNSTVILNSRAAAANSNTTLPEIPSDNQHFDTSLLPNPSSAPVSHRGLPTAKPTGQQPATGSQLSVPHIENPIITTLPAHTSPVAPGSYHAPPSSMGINGSAPDISRLQSYRQAPIHHASVPLNNIPPQRRISATPMSPAYPSRPFPDKRSATLPPPPIKGKPLIFTAMASVDPGSARIPLPDRTPPVQAPAPAPVQYINPPFRPPQPPPARHGYPTPPPDVSYPQRRESLASPQDPRQLPRLQVFNQHSTPQLISPPREIHPHPMGASNQTNDPVARRSPSKIKKLTKARTAGKSASDVSTLSTHSHSSSTSISGSIHRPSSSKGLPTTPTPSSRVPTTPTPSSRVLPSSESVASPIQIEGDVVGIPLDDDPFANTEGVKVVNPVSRPPSPTNSTLKGRRSKSTLRSMASRDELRAELPDVPERKSYAEPKASEVKSTNHPPDCTEEPETSHLRDEAGRKDIPPVTSSVAEEPEDQEDQDQEDRLTGFLSDPHFLWSFLPFLSFYDWCLVLSLSRVIRYTLVQHPQLRETVLERFLKPVGYTRWAWEEADPVSLSLQNLSDYMRGVSTPTHEYARVAGLYVHSLSMHPNLRDESLIDMVGYLSASCRAYTRVVLRIRAQAEKEASMLYARGNVRIISSPPSRTSSPTMSSNHSYTSGGHTPLSPTLPNSAVNALSSPLFRLRRAPLLRVFVPSPDGDWLSDKSVLACEAECRRAGVTPLMRVGDVVWDVAVGDEGNVGRLVWDGSYLIDLDYTYSPIGDLPKYMPTLAFPPSYFHRVIRMGAASTNPVAHIDLRPWGEEIAHNLQLLQDRVRTETPQGNYHNVVRWVNRSSFVIRPPNRGAMWSPSQNSHYSGPVSPRIPIPESNGLFVDPGWYGTIVVETEGTNEALADLQDRCGPGAFPPRPQGVNGRQINRDQKKVFRILREKSRPGEIWIRAVSAKERLL